LVDIVMTQHLTINPIERKGDLFYQREAFKRNVTISWGKYEMRNPTRSRKEKTSGKVQKKKQEITFL